MKKYLLTLFFLGIIILLPKFVNAATLSLSPSSGSYSVGQIFTVNILLDTQGQSIDGVDIRYLNYNPSQLEVQDDNATQTGIQITTGNLMPLTQANNVDKTTGKITFSQITAGGSTFKSSGAQILATIHFKILQAVNTTVSFDYVSGRTSDSNIASVGVDILTGVTNGAYGPTSQPPSAPYCGDGACNGSETCSTCSSDCGQCVIPAPAPTSTSVIPPTTPITQTSTPSSSSCVALGTLKGPFGIGRTSEEIKLLQQMLSQDKIIYPEAMVTGYYGNLTIKAVQKFQCKYNIVCSGAPNTSGYGLAGPSTRAKLNQVFSTTGTTCPATPALAITKYLYLGLTNSEVTTLQQILAKDITVYPEGKITGYFGNLTQKAVKSFQCKYQIICSGDPQTTGYGAVGPKTRTKLNEIGK